MARTHTHYDNLKVARNAPPEVIRAAYKILSQKYHPDHNPNNPDAMRIIQIINAAYEVLADPIKRQEHDKWIRKTEAQDATSTSSSTSSSNHTQSKTSRNVYRNMPFDMRKPPAKAAVKTLKAVQKAWMILGHFSKYLSRKMWLPYRAQYQANPIHS